MREKPTTPESDVVYEILQAFEGDPDCRLFRRNVGATKVETPNGKRRFIQFAEKGQSDIWGVAKSRCPKCGTEREGVHVEIECKSEKGRLRPEQEEYIRQMNRIDAIAFVVRPTENGVFGLRKAVQDEINRVCKRCLAPKSVAGPFNRKTISVEEFKAMIGKQQREA